MNRSLAVAQDAFVRPVRSLPHLLAATVDSTFAFLSDPEITSGFLLLTAVGMLYTLSKCDIPLLRPEERPARLHTPLLWLGSIVQIACLPILWAYVSDNPQFLGRFSIRYAPFILLNIAMLVVDALLLWQRKRVNARLIQFGPRLRTAINMLLVTFSTMLALEITAIRIYALLYLLCTIVLFLASLVWESPATVPLLSLRRASLS